MAGPIGDLALNAEMKRDEDRAMRMTAVSMLLDMHKSGIPVFETHTNGNRAHVVSDTNSDMLVPGQPLPANVVLANVHDAIKKWAAFIKDGQAIGK